MTMGRNYNFHRVALITEAQAFTTSWADLGAEIEMVGWNALGIWITLDVNAAANMRIRALAKLDPAGTNEYILPIKTVGASSVSIEDEYYEFNDDADALFLLEVETDGLIPIIQLQCVVGTDGGADAEVDYLEVTKSWK